MARPERFELPTPWFVGGHPEQGVYVNQELATLANIKSVKNKGRLATISYNTATYGIY